MYEFYEHKDDEFDDCVNEIREVLRKYKMKLSFGSPRRQHAGTFISLSRTDLPKMDRKDRFFGQVIK